MEKKKFEVQIYYTGYCTYLINAESEDEAILKARKEKIKVKEVCSNFENWEDADVAVVMKNGKNTGKNTL